MSTKTIKYSLIILTRNEITGLRSVFKYLSLKDVDECFAVDYESTDGTLEFFRKHHIPVVSQKIPGQAEAFYLGAKRARGKYLIFFAPDGNENPIDIPIIIRYLDKGYDLVIGSRFIKGGRNEEDDQSIALRAWVNRAFTGIANLLWRGNVTDSINGFRGIKKTAFNSLCLDATGFAIEYQMTIRALKLRLKIGEFPTIEHSRIGGTSSALSIPTGSIILYFLLREVLIGMRFLPQK